MSLLAVASGAWLPFNRLREIFSAVNRAVPDGASNFSGWCDSTISTDSKYGAAIPANAIMSTAPMLKFGAINTREFGR